MAPVSSIRLNGKKKIDPQDPFDIPPMSPTTAVNSPPSSDPFNRFSDQFIPIQRQIQVRSICEQREPDQPIANESQS
ncbi:hypothetical protein J3B02_002879, partial [Coemansia erecta]